MGGASVGGGRVATGSGVLVGGAGVAVSVGSGVSVAVAVAVAVSVGTAVAVSVGSGVAVAVWVGVLVGGTAVCVAVTALISWVANNSVLAVASSVGGISCRSKVEPLAKNVTANPIRPVKPTTITESNVRFLMVTSPGESDFNQPDNQKPLTKGIRGLQPDLKK